jgi:hypothetical protein
MTPLPSARKETEVAPKPPRGSFVDDEVVMALVAGRNCGRDAADSTGLALAVDEDFAGWCLETSSFSYPRRKVVVPVAQSVPRRAAPPELEPGLGEPHLGAHRWWMAGMAGALCALLFSTLVFSLADESMNESDGISIIRVPAKPKSSPTSGETKSPELTGNPPPPAIR